MRTRAFKRCELFLVVVLGVLLSGPAETASAEQLLRWKMAAGESLTYQFTQSTQTETAGAGKPMRVALETAMTVTWKIESVDAQQVYAIAQTIDAFKVTMKTDKLDPIVYDSTAKSAPAGPAREIAEGVAKLLGAPCRIQMTDRGEIVSVEPSEQLKQSVAPASANPLSSPTKGPVTAASGMLTLEGMTQILRQAAVVLPEKPVSAGTKWEVKQTLATPASTVLLGHQFTYLGAVERDGAMLDKIAIETSFTLDSGPAGSAPSLKLKEGSQTGTLWFDSAAGRVVGSELSQRLVTERPYRDLSIRVQSTSTLGMQLMK